MFLFCFVQLLLFYHLPVALPVQIRVFIASCEVIASSLRGDCEQAAWP